MAQVTVMVNGQRYQLACNDGEEERLLSLAGYVDSKIGALIESIGNVGDLRLLLMASLIIADELMEAKDGPPQKGDAELIKRLTAAAGHLEDIAGRLEKA